MTTAKTVGAERDGIVLKLDTKGLETSFARAPSSSFFWLRTFLFSSMLAHRTYWLKAKSTKFGRGSDKSKAIKVWRINEAPKTAPKPNWVTYRVHPDQKREPDAKRAAALLPTLAGEAAAGSIVLEVHQKGTDIRVPDWLAIPLRTRPRTPKAWRKENPGKVLVTIPDKARPDRLYLAERIRYRGRRAAGVTPRQPEKTKVVRDKLRRRFLLLKFVEMDPTLNFYESWDQQEGNRAKDFAKIGQRILEDIARGKFA